MSRENGRLDYDGNYIPDRLNGIAGCTNDSCFMSKIIMEDMESEEQARAAWNKRAPSVPAVPLEPLCRYLEVYARTPIYNMRHTAEWWKEELNGQNWKKWMEENK